MKKCIVCGADFEPKNPKGKFCSDKCKMKAARDKKKLIFAKPEEKLKPEVLSETKIKFAKTTPESYDGKKIDNIKDEYNPFDNWRYKAKMGEKDKPKQ